jgi:NADPH:quinone reductase-like Zn-dependent oxidoreductase
MLIRTLAASISVGDHRNLNGSTALVRSPPSFPFIPCHDVCGIVQVVGSKAEGFKVGDRIAATGESANYGGLAEYCVVDSKGSIEG